MTFATSALLQPDGPIPISASFELGDLEGSITFDKDIVSATALGQPVWRGLLASRWNSTSIITIGGPTVTWGTTFAGGSTGSPRVSYTAAGGHEILAADATVAADFTNFPVT